MLEDSAGNSRGLIEARGARSPIGPARSRIPRGTPAASLKHGLDRGRLARLVLDSAGNSRGLIEALSFL